jgi:type 1 fimbria pilin
VPIPKEDTVPLRHTPQTLRYEGTVKLHGQASLTGVGVRLMDSKGQPLLDELLEPGTYNATIVLERI